MAVVENRIIIIIIIKNLKYIVQRTAATVQRKLSINQNKKKKTNRSLITVVTMTSKSTGKMRILTQCGSEIHENFIKTRNVLEFDQSNCSLCIIFSHILAKLLSISYKKAQLTLSNPRDVKACKNCSNSTCFVSFHRIPFPRISKFRPRPM